MTTQDVYKEIEATFGLVPSFFKVLPEQVLEQEWALFRRGQLEETALPAKYKHLAGLAVAAAVHCPYCTIFHTALARANGATEEEIRDSVHVAKDTVGWSAYLHGMQMDPEQFREELEQAMEHMKKAPAHA